MVTEHGDVVWVDFGHLRGSEPVKIRPTVVLQENWRLATEINTVLVVPVTSNVSQETFPGNVLVPPGCRVSKWTRSRLSQSSDR